MKQTKKLLAIVLCIAVLSSLFIGLDLTRASAFGTMNDARYVGAHNLSNMLQSGFERRSFLFPESEGGNGDEETYVTETTGLRPTRLYEKLDATRLEVTIPEYDNNWLEVGDDVNSKFFLTVANRRTAVTSKTTPENIPEPDDLALTSTTFKAYDKYITMYIEYYIEELPEVPNAYARVGIGYSSANADTNNFVKTNILEVSGDYKQAGKWGRLSALIPLKTTAGQDVRILFDGTPGAKIHLVFVSSKTESENMRLLRYHIPYGDNYDMDIIEPTYMGTAYNGGAAPTALAGAGKVPQYDDHFVMSYYWDSDTADLGNCGGRLGGMFNAMYNYQMWYVPKDNLPDTWYYADGTVADNSSKASNFDNGSTIDVYASLDMLPTACQHENKTVIEAVASTCCTAGHAEYTKCDDCGAVVEGSDAALPLDPNNHEGETEVRDDKDATCTEAGYTGDTYCLGCGAKIADGEETEFADHTIGDWLTDKTNHWHYCSVCEGILDQAEHTYEWVVTKQASPEEAGLREEICSVCGHKSGNTEDIEYVSHMAGDINGDGSVNNKDLTRLFQYLSDWDVQVDESALDVNGDGSVNNKDLTRLFQYLSDWVVEIF